MPRFFNTTGPCDLDKHYMLPPEQRLPDLMRLVREEQYFVIHAARQTGKSTAMRAFAERLRALGYAAVYATLEASQGVTETADAEPLWLESIDASARRTLPPALQPVRYQEALAAPVGARLKQWLTGWAEKIENTSVVLLLDEADVISGPALVSLLRQLRAGFIDRPRHFPASVALVGMRDLRDYLTQSKDGQAINPGSPFNIKSESITLRNFNEAEVGELYAQHTADTGQVFTPEAVQRAFYWTQGQPYLINKLASICVQQLLTQGQPITAPDIDTAKERLIQARTTHLDALAERLKEPRVAPIIRAILLGDENVPYESDNYQYVVDLGLIRKGPDGAEPANPLYREVLARQLSYNTQENLRRPWWPWRTPEGQLDMPALIDAFLEWWRENAEMVEEVAAAGYLEAVPHLAFMAFLQRVINGGGTITREYAAGREALDLVVDYAGARSVIELKRVPPKKVALETVKKKGIRQLQGYLDTLGETHGYLLIFDQRPNQTWEQRLWQEEVAVNGKVLHLRGA